MTHEQHVAAAERLVGQSRDQDNLDQADRLNYATQALTHATLARAIAPREKAPAKVFLASMILPNAAKVIHAAASQEALVSKLRREYSIPAEWQDDVDMWADENDYQIRWVECEL